MPSPSNHPRDPLHGTTLEAILNQLVQRYGWGELWRRIPVRCFQLKPSIKSSLTFLRKTPWAREKIEAWFIGDQRRSERSAPTIQNAAKAVMVYSPPPPLAAIQTAASLQALWQTASPQNWDSFVAQLDHGTVPYLSHSKLRSLERCPLCYYRQYVVGEERGSTTMNVGTLFHQAAKEFYHELHINKPSTPPTPGLQINTESLSEESQLFLHNALELLQANYWADQEVLSVEEGFFMDLAPDLPPILGVPELVLRHNGSILVVDHKTSKSFGNPDPSQLVLFAEYLRRQYSTDAVTGVFDEYRLVRNLSDVRKPAFQRTRVSVDNTLLPDLTARYRKAWEKIVLLHQNGQPTSSPDCRRCN